MFLGLILALFAVQSLCVISQDEQIRAIVVSVLDRGQDGGIITPRQKIELEELIPTHFPNIIATIHENKEREEILQIQENLENKNSVLKITQDLTFKTFGYVKDGLTLLNVLYFGGGMVILTSMSLFVTVGFSQFGTAGLFYIGFSYIVFFHTSAFILWHSYEQYKIIAGIFATIGVGICPFVIFSFLDVIKYLNHRGGDNYRSFHIYISSSFVPIEIGTGIFGLFTILIVPFPFITMPVAFCLWYLTMDISEYFARGNLTWKIRCQVSVVSGFIIMLGGLFIEKIINPSTDFSFWIYLFGLIAFWSGLSFQESDNSFNKILYILIQVGLIVSSHTVFLDRYMFAFFGLLGFLAIYTAMAKDSMRKSFDSFWFCIAFIAPIIVLFGTTFPLLSMNDNDSSFIHEFSFFSTESAAFIGSIYALACCQLMYQTIYIHSIWSTFRYIHFIFFIGLLYATSSLFKMYILFPILENSLHLLIPSWIPVLILSIIASIAVFTPTAPGFAGFSFISQTIELIFALWLIIYNGSIYLTFEFTSIEFYIRLGLIIIGIVPFLIHGFKQSLQGNNSLPRMLEAFFYFSIAGSAILYYLESTLLFFIPFAGFWSIIPPFMYHDGKRTKKLIIGLILIIFAVVLDSKLLISLGGFHIFSYLSYLSSIVFRNSLLFPLFLTSIGLWIIGIGFLYQWYYEIVRNLIIEKLSFYFSNISILSLFSYASGPSQTFDRLFYYLSDVVQYFIHNQKATWILLASISVLFALASYFKIHIWSKRAVINPRSPAHINIDHLQLFKTTSRPDHGFSIRIKGTKPSNLTINQAWIHIDDKHSWDVFESVAPSFAIQIFKSSMHPIKMCPMMVNKDSFENNSSTFDVTVEFGAGTNGGPSISHATLFATISRLHTTSHIPLRIVFESSSKINSNHVIHSKSGFLGLIGSPIIIGNLCTIDLNPRAVTKCARGVVNVIVNGRPQSI